MIEVCYRAVCFRCRDIIFERYTAPDSGIFPASHFNRVGRFIFCDECLGKAEEALRNA